MNERFDIGRADRAHVWHPYTQHAAAGDALPIASARGAFLRDESGREVFDAISSWWVTLHGHAHPVIAAAIADQAARLEQVIFAGFTHEPAARLAAELVRIAPQGLQKVFFSDDGSTAVEVALKMAVQFWANAGDTRSLIVAFEHAYHGDTFGAMSVSERGLFTAPFSSLMFDVVRIGTTGDPAAELETLIRARGSEIAAVIVEPMLQGAGGMRISPPDLLTDIRRLTADQGILLIADEVLTGFGRTGPLFACEHAGVSPDILCLSKGLTGGFLPLAATLATNAIFERFVSENRERTFFHGHSFTANPIACAAALASISLLDKGSAARRTLIEHSHHEAASAFAAHPAVRNPRVLGTLLAFELADGASDYLNPVGRALNGFALARGIFLRPLGNTVYMLPPYCSGRAELTRAYGVIGEFLDTL